MAEVCSLCAEDAVVEVSAAPFVLSVSHFTSSDVGAWGCTQGWCNQQRVVVVECGDRFMDTTRASRFS